MGRGTCVAGEACVLRTPPAMHTPTMHAPFCHTCPPLPHIPPPHCHACPLPHMPPPTHAPCHACPPDACPCHVYPPTMLGPPRHAVNDRAVRILLACILVFFSVCLLWDENNATLVLTEPQNFNSVADPRGKDMEWVGKFPPEPLLAPVSTFNRVGSFLDGISISRSGRNFFECICKFLVNKSKLDFS